MDHKMSLSAYRRTLTLVERLPQPKKSHVDEHADRYYGGNREGEPS
jgi:hypothetical protein